MSYFDHMMGLRPGIADKYDGALITHVSHGPEDRLNQGPTDLWHPLEIRVPYPPWPGAREFLRVDASGEEWEARIGRARAAMERQRVKKLVGFLRSLPLPAPTITSEMETVARAAMAVNLVYRVPKNRGAARPTPKPTEIKWLVIPNYIEHRFEYPPLAPTPHQPPLGYGIVPSTCYACKAEPGRDDRHQPWCPEVGGWYCAACRAYSPPGPACVTCGRDRKAAEIWSPYAECPACGASLPDDDQGERARCAECGWEEGE